MVMAGWMGTEALGAHQITLNLTSLAFMVPLGIAIGGATRVGNLIGARDAGAAQRAFGLAVRLALYWSAFAAPLIFVFRSNIAAVFTSDPRVLESVAFLTIFVAIFQPLDAVHAVGAGVLRGMGRPTVPALMNFVGFAVGLPLAYLWGVRGGHGILAIWVALTLRLGAVSAGVYFWARRTARLPLDDLTVRSRA
jgi:MATE family multidrug resistance protein